MDAFFLVDQQWVLFINRVVLGVVMIYYGYPKVRDLGSNAKDFVKMGFKPGWFWGTIVALLELFGGIAVTLGFLAPLVAAAFGAQMIVGTLWKIKVKKPFTDYSYDLQLLAMSLVLLAFGSGYWGLDTNLFF